jgi:hypothetical protein
MGLIMPGIKGLFSPINKALQGEPQVIGLGKTINVRAAFLDLAQWSSTWHIARPM